MKDVTVQTDDKLTADEVVKLRLASGWDGDLQEWEKCLKQLLIAVSARNQAGELVGVGFLSGDVRRAEIVDLVVLPSFRKHTIGARILDQLINYAKTEKVKYLGITYDKKSPWLRGFYESHGFRSIDFALWHEDSLRDK